MLWTILHANFFLRKTIPNKMFHSDYKHIIDRLPESLVKRACERLLHHSKDPIPLESIFGKSERIESYLRLRLLAETRRFRQGVKCRKAKLCRNYIKVLLKVGETLPKGETAETYYKCRNCRNSAETIIKL